MSHFEVGDWVDYVRGIAARADAAEMASHLGTHCPECTDSHNWLKQVGDVAKTSSLMQVPAELLCRAENIFDRPPAFQFHMLFPLSATLVFDAGRVFQPAGIRSASAVDHTLHQAGDFMIDLRQESERGSARISLVGQISTASDTEETNAAFPVALFSGTAVISNARSNSFGEFSLTYTWRPNLKLAIAVLATGRRIDIPLAKSPRGKIADKEALGNTADKEE